MPRAARPDRERRGGPALQLALILALTQAPPVEFQEVRVGPVQAVAAPEDLELARGLAATAARAESWYGIGPRSVGPLRLFVVRGNERVAKLMQQQAPSWGAGFAFPESHTVLIRPDQGDPYQTLRHELAHLVLHDVVKVRLPLWFDEGYAALAAGELDRLEALRLDLAVASGRVPNLLELDRGLRAAESTAQSAYALAASAVALLARRNPSHSLGPLLGRLGTGEDFEAAVLATTGLTLGRFELDWQHDVRLRFGLVGWLMAGGIWALVGALVVVALWFRRRRDRPRRSALDVGWVVPPEEADEPAPPLDEAGPTP